MILPPRTSLLYQPAWIPSFPPLNTVTFLTTFLPFSNCTLSTFLQLVPLPPRLVPEVHVLFVFSTLYNSDQVKFLDIKWLGCHWSLVLISPLVKVDKAYFLFRSGKPYSWKMLSCTACLLNSQISAISIKKKKYRVTCICIQQPAGSHANLLPVNSATPPSRPRPPLPSCTLRVIAVLPRPLVPRAVPHAPPRLTWREGERGVDTASLP